MAVFGIVLSLLVLCSSNGVAQSLLVRSDNSTQKASELTPPSAQLQTAALSSIIAKQTPFIEADIPLAIGTEHLRLVRSSLLAKNARVVRGNAQGDIPYAIERYAAVYKGKLADGSPVILTLMPQSIMGFVLQNGALHPLSDMGTLGEYRLYDGTLRSFAPQCLTDEHSLSSELLAMMQQEYTKHNSLQSNERIVIDVAVDAEYSYLKAFGNDTAKASAYLLSIFAASSAIYERDVNAEFRIVFLRMWESLQPYSATVYDFARYWRQSMQSIDCDAAHCISTSSSNGGGIAARIGGICTDSGSFARSSLRLDFKNADTYSYDAYLISHEFGHVFGSAHTHSCLWRGGPIDNCGPMESGPCTFINPPPTKGTIMSYCSQTVIGINLEFHPMCRQMMRSYLERAACTGMPSTTVPTHTLRGIVSDQNGTPLRDVELHLRPQNIYYWAGTPPIPDDTVCITDAEGKYLFRHLVSGFYQVAFPKNSTVLPEIANESPLAYAQRTMVMVQDSDVKKDWKLKRVYGVSLTLPIHNTQNLPLLVIMRLDSVYASMPPSRFVVQQSPMNLNLSQGKYLVFPYCDGYEYTPAYSIITIDSAHESNLVFQDSASTRRTYCGIAYQRKMETQPFPFTPAVKNPINLGIVASAPNDIVTTDSNGVFVSRLPGTIAPEYCRFHAVDTSLYYLETPQVTINRTSIPVLLRRERRQPFIERYRFDSYTKNFSSITSLGNSVSYNNGSALLDIPFDFRYGYSPYNRLTAYDYGAVSFGYLELYFARARPFLYHIPPMEGLLQLNHPDMYAINSSRHVQSWSYTEGIAPQRVFVVQWDFTYRGTADSLAFSSQLRLHEQDNTIEFAYGRCEGNSTQFASSTIGIQGSDPYDIHVRFSLKDWESTTRGAVPYHQMSFLPNSLPPSGLVFRWRDTTQQVLAVEDAEKENVASPIRLLADAERISLELPRSMGIAENDILSLELFSPIGECVFSHILHHQASALQVQFPPLAQGSYYVRLRVGNRMFVQPILILH